MRVLISILLLLVFISCMPSEATTIPNDAAVVDASGEKLLPNANYTIITPTDNGHSGLNIYLRNNTCPFNVAQAKSWHSHGSPLTFLPANSSDGVVKQSTNVNIVFGPTATICGTTMVWRVTDPESMTGRQYVTVGGVTGNQGPSTWRNWFKIEKCGEYYKLVFCPRVCRYCKRACRNVGVFEGERYRWLGLSDVPMQVMFLKV